LEEKALPSPAQRGNGAGRKTSQREKKKRKGDAYTRKGRKKSFSTKEGEGFNRTKGEVGRQIEKKVS